VGFVQDEDGDRPAGYGVVFLDVAEEGRALIIQYARSRDPVLYEV
jgi:hypothetical protein